MPTLDFKGKQFVYAHHLGVPFRQLDIVPKKSIPAKGGKPGLEDNLIIHGDNLHALKALLPQYAGKVKCIYIDPPYNTGNEGWCYNDNVNAPLMKEWLKKDGNPVDREDLERHDKWLCMMWPRLQLLRELLADDGVIFVSIDDNESTHLRMMMDEIYGESNFLAQLTVLSNPKGRGMGEHFARSHDYVLTYQKNKLKDELSVAKTDDEVTGQYPEIGEDGRRYRVLELRNTHREFGKHNRPNLYYPFYVMSSGNISLDKVSGAEKVLPNWDDGFEGCWGWGEEKSRLEMHDLLAKKIGEKWKIYRKAYAHSKDGSVVTKKLKTVLTDAGFHTEKGQQVLGEIFSERVFPSPKPPNLLKALISLIADKNAIVLDSFGGSGTTAHAVLALNKEDGGNRKFILVECEDYADATTAERVRRVIKGVPTAKDDALKSGLGGSFTYCELGQEINIDNLLKGEKLPDYDELARYAFYTATGQTLDKVKKGADYFVGETDQYRVHVIYKPDAAFLRSGESALNAALAADIAKARGQKTALVFSTHKFMSQKELTELGITYCQLPYAIHRVMGD